MRLHRRHVSVAIMCCLLILSAAVVCVAPASADGVPADLGAFIGAWRASNAGQPWPAECDLNGDGVLDTRDAALLFETQKLAVPTGTQPFSVDTAELHADPAAVDVVTSWQDHASDGGGGTLDTTVSQAGAQVVVATDGQVRGLALSIPGAATPVRIDAESTALALAFLTPGIGASDPSDAQARAAELKAMPEFTALVAIIRSGLASGPLPTVTATDAYNAALQALVESWITAHEPVATAALTYDAGEAEFSIEPPTNPTKLASVHVTLRNDAWRYVHIVRRDLRADSSEIIHLTVPGRDLVMPGATPVGWGSMFTWTVGAPCFRDDYVNFTPERGCVRSQYWIVGPGLASGDARPAGVINSALELDAWGISILHYAVLPQLELLTGTLNAAQASSMALRLWGIVKKGLDLRDLANSSTQTELLRNTTDIAMGVIQGIASSSGALSLVGGNPYLLAFLLGGSKIFADANYYSFTRAVGSLPRCTRLEVRQWGGSDNPPPGVKVTADTTNLTPGQTTTLHWSTANAATISSSNFGATTLSGKVIVKPAASTYYKLTVSGPGGTTTGGVWVYVGSGGGGETGPDGGKMVWVAPGEFMMGADDLSDECKPIHLVRITKGFWLGKCEVTNAQYAAFLNAHGSNQDGSGERLIYESGYDYWTTLYCKVANQGGTWVALAGWENHPVVYVTWYGAKAYCDHYGLRLPTEAEWEYAARGSAGRLYPWGDTWDESKCCNYYNMGPGYNAGTGPGTMPVGSLPAGDSWCGASDLAGNVWEWCNDWWDDGSYYSISPTDDPQGPGTDDWRLFRGCSWGGGDLSCRSANRHGYYPWGWLHSLGFRVARTP